MQFASPQLLWLLAVLPVLVGVYVWLIRRRAVVALRYPGAAIAREARPGSIRRHLPPALLLLALAAMIVSLARPTASIDLVARRQTLILAIDVSLSMRAADVAPDRITAAQSAAKAFIEALPSNLRVGVVAFGGTALLVQAPTTDRAQLMEAVDRFQLQGRTATGSAIMLSLATLFPDDAALDLESVVLPPAGTGTGSRRANGGGSSRSSSGSIAGRARPDVAGSRNAPVPPGSYRDAAIVLLSDGQRTAGPDPLDAAFLAADRGVKVYTVGFGTTAGTEVRIGQWSVLVRLDEDTLKAIAEVTRAEYFHAGTAADLDKVYRDLNGRLVVERKRSEITALFALAAALALALACGLSWAWFGAHR